ncbi:MAG: hypothetical protein LT103_09030 [Burkholderiaceae bacterium]|nr:hypothetical protein [Burkholderiaceae bacterium]
MKRRLCEELSGVRDMDGDFLTGGAKGRPVKFPEPLRSHTLSNMRDHLGALAEIQEALAKGDFDRAAAIARDSSVTGDWKAVFGAQARVNRTCVACHAGFRLE